MKCKEIIELIENEFPMKYAESWDNTGFQVGNREKEVSHIFVAMDVTDENIEEAIHVGADMIVTHHPMIFAPLCFASIAASIVAGLMPMLWKMMRTSSFCRS